MALVCILVATMLVGPQPQQTTPPAAATKTGTVSHMSQDYGRLYLALPEHRWGRPGIPVIIKGPGGKVVRRSTDAGPDKAMQRAGRIADLNWWDFMKVCGVGPGEPDPGLCRVTITYIHGRAQSQSKPAQPKPMPTLPPTDTAS